MWFIHKKSTLYPQAGKGAFARFSRLLGAEKDSFKKVIHRRQLFLRLHDCAHGEGDVDALLAVAARQCLDEFVLQQELIDEAARAQHDVELDGGVAEGVEAHDGIALDAVIERRHDLVRHLKCHALHLVEVARIADADGNGNGDFLRRHVVVRENGGCELLVRHDDRVAAQCLHRREAEVDVGDLALLRRRDTHIVADADLAREDELQPRENVRQRLLHTEGERRAADAHRREDRRDGDARILQDDEHAHGIDDARKDGGQERRLRQRRAARARLHLDESRDRARSDARQREDDDAEEDVGKELRDRREEVDGLDRPVDADAHAPRDGHAAQRMDEDRPRRVLADRDPLTNLPVDELVEEYADRQRREHDARRHEQEIRQLMPCQLLKFHKKGQNLSSSSMWIGRAGKAPAWQAMPDLSPKFCG